MKKVFFFLFLFLIFSGTFSWGENEDIKQFFPKERNGWTKSKEFKLYNQKNLFDYIDGGAEIYLAYDFKKLAVQKYEKDEQAIIIEIYQMNSSPDAFGIFSLDQEGEVVFLGQKGIYSWGVLRFWKGDNFVKIMDISGKDDNRKTIFSWGKEILDKIKGENPFPNLLSFLPKDNLIENKVRFFHKQIILNNLYFLSNENVLNLNAQTNAVLADYKFDKGILRLLLIEYPDSFKAEEGFSQFAKVYLKMDNLQEKVVKTENGPIGISRMNSFLALVFEGKESKLVNDFLLNMEKNLRMEGQNEKDNQKRIY
jgi:hypothetical protein